ncbi:MULTISPECIES: metallophosphoesterase [unclassified Rhizobium]|uniref:metallophosphoesterase family protein n=1 Tax=unclassified Rhizobium TaxID=2613769 RepID=UPI0006FCF208|nr:MULTISPECIES: metallophosphoesterase [unclassified Rhizobium]KQV38070.1 hypothetical protein ASC86_07475 [Rhizobium sp. Root1212]KRD30727.1 hypothetical protein ASE37_07470 [Rhizobium sp. Root268]
MPPSSAPRIAIVADVHYHDVYGNYGVEGVFDDAGRRMALRRLSDTVKSTRVFNESHAALRRTLDDIAAAGIGDVVLLGDYSDDGQVATVKSLRLLLEDYQRRHGLRFHALPGNHDIFALDGRHRTKRFLTGDGGYSVATSDAGITDADAAEIVVTPAMYCPGYPEGLSNMAAFGFFPRGDELHWETPFGSEAAVEGRTYEVRSPDGRVRRRLMEASYLVEPLPDVWLLMIDANVFAPVDGIAPGDAGDFADSTDAGWNGMLKHKAFLFDWFADVARRAKAAGKCLMAFSHYPAIDPLDGTRDAELALLGRTGMVKRIPDAAVAERLMAAGIAVHFSGHLHVNDTARSRSTDGGYLVNVAVPSLVAFPCGYKVVTIHPDRLEIDTPGLDDLARDPVIRRCYQMEMAASPSPLRGEGTRRADQGVLPVAPSQPSPSSGPTGHLLPAGEKGKQGAGWEVRQSLARVQAADDYGTFLYEHLGHLVGRRHLKREWPKALADALWALDLADLVLLAKRPEDIALADAKTVTADEPQAADAVALMVESRRLGLSAMDFLADWYRLRMGSELALPWIGAEKLGLYDGVAALYPRASWPADTAQASFALLFAMYERYRSGLPSNRFSIRRADGAISAQS